MRKLIRYTVGLPILVILSLTHLIAFLIIGNFWLWCWIGDKIMPTNYKSITNECKYALGFAINVWKPTFRMN